MTNEHQIDKKYLPKDHQGEAWFDPTVLRGIATAHLHTPETLMKIRPWTLLTLLDAYERMHGTYYQMVVNGEVEWLPFHDAAVAYDSGWVPVQFGSLVLEHGTPREMTPKDKLRISDAAEDYSASK